MFLQCKKKIASSCKFQHWFSGYCFIKNLLLIMLITKISISWLINKVSCPCTNN